MAKSDEAIKKRKLSATSTTADVPETRSKKPRVDKDLEAAEEEDSKVGSNARAEAEDKQPDSIERRDALFPDEGKPVEFFVFAEDEFEDSLYHLMRKKEETLKLFDGVKHLSGKEQIKALERLDGVQDMIDDIPLWWLDSTESTDTEEAKAIKAASRTVDIECGEKGRGWKTMSFARDAPAPGIPALETALRNADTDECCGPWWLVSVRTTDEEEELANDVVGCVGLADRMGMISMYG